MKINKEEFLLGAIRKFSSSFDILEATSSLIKYINQYIKTDILILAIMEPAFKAQRFLCFATLEKAQWLDRLVPFPADIVKEATDVDISETLIWEYSTDSIDPYIRSQFGIEEGDRSSLLLPLPVGDEIIARLAFVKAGKGQYNQDQIDFLSPLKESFAMVLSNSLKHREIAKLKEMLADDNQYLREELHKLSDNEIIGQQGGLKQVMEMVSQVAPLKSPVLLFGETGTGKELIANAIHYASPRKNNPFIKVNCGAIPESLVETELFGHEKGAFTGALQQKRGRFERANGGTIFLDEIGELPLQAQVKLLRAIQHKEIERVGGTQTIPVDVRVITATHRDLEHMANNKLFREDLLYRLNVFPIVIPPLRYRKADIPLLVDHLINKKIREMKLGDSMRLAPGALDLLISYEWKGNVRELENVVERAIIRNQQGILRFDDLVATPETPSISAEQPSDTILPYSEMNRRHIQQVLKQTNHKISGKGGAAELLHLKVTTLRAKMKKLGIPFKKDR